MKENTARQRSRGKTEKKQFNCTGGEYSDGGLGMEGGGKG